MAKKKADGPNKSQSIREYYAANPKAKAKDVIAALGKQGIKVTGGLVYLVKAKAGSKKRRQKREKDVAAVTAVTHNGDALSVIRKVKGLAEEVGGMSKLRQLVEALS